MPPARPGILAGPNSNPALLGGRYVSPGGIATTADIDTDCCANCCCTAKSWQVVLAGLTLCSCATMTQTTATPDGLCVRISALGVFDGGPHSCFYEFAGTINGAFCIDQVTPGACSYTGPGPAITITAYPQVAPFTGDCMTNPTVVSTTTEIDLSIDVVTGQITTFLVISPTFIDPITGLPTSFTFFAFGGSTNRYCGVKCLEYPPLANVITDCVYTGTGAGSAATGGTATLSPKCCLCGDFNDDFNDDFALGC